MGVHQLEVLDDPEAVHRRGAELIRENHLPAEKAFEFNRRMDKYALKPIAMGWKTAVPQPAGIMIANAFDNITVVPVALDAISDCMKSRRAIGSKLASGSSVPLASGAFTIRPRTSGTSRRVLPTSARLSASGASGPDRTSFSRSWSRSPSGTASSNNRISTTTRSCGWPRSGRYRRPRCLCLLLTFYRSFRILLQTIYRR